MTDEKRQTAVKAVWCLKAVIAANIVTVIVPTVIRGVAQRPPGGTTIERTTTEGTTTARMIIGKTITEKMITTGKTTTGGMILVVMIIGEMTITGTMVVAMTGTEDGRH